MPHTHDDGPFGDEEYVRVGGVLVPVNNGHEVRHEDGTIAPDDIIEDLIAADGVPGTPDDIPYDYGVEIAFPADQMMLSVERGSTGLGSVGRTGSDPDHAEQPLGAPEERELWRRQRPLIEESGDEATRYAGIPESEIPRIEAAIGEDAAETLPETPEGKSATGSV